MNARSMLFAPAVAAAACASAGGDPVDAAPGRDVSLIDHDARVSYDARVGYDARVDAPDANIDAAAPVTLEVSIAAGSDDADQYPDLTVVVDGSWLFLNLVGDMGGFRFQLDIPQGAVISEAFVELYIQSSGSASPDMTWAAEAVDSAQAFSTGDDNIGGRTLTAASVQWVGTDLGTGYQSTPDLKSVIQEVVDRPGWTTGNHLVLIAQAADPSAFYTQQFENAGGKPAKLIVTFTAP